MDIDLVQRCTIKRPLVTARVSQSLNLDYMGSSEFEFGATRRSLIALYATAGQLRRVNCSGIKDTGGRVLRCFSAFQGFSPDEYAAGLEDLIAGRKHCREFTGLGLACGSKGESSIIRTSDADFWWDLGNHAMFSFDKVFVNRLPQVLQESWQYMKLHLI